jgi:hypothetical protein
MARDVRLTRASAGYYDLLMEDGSFQWAEDGTQVAQHGSIRIQKYAGESVTSNPNEDGTDYYGIVFNAQTSAAEKTLEIRRRILQTPGVIRILDGFTYSIEGATIKISGSVLTEWGEEDISQEITQL